MASKIIERASDSTVVELGDIVRDDVTGFEGLAESITIWRFGCRRIGVKPMKLKDDGSVADAQVFDEPQLHIIKRANVPQQTQVARRVAGGPKDPAAERRALSRA